MNCNDKRIHELQIYCTVSEGLLHQKCNGWQFLWPLTPDAGACHFYMSLDTHIWSTVTQSTFNSYNSVSK